MEMTKETKEERKKTTVTLRLLAKHHQAIKILAVQKETTMQALIDEFMADGLKKYNIKIDE